MASVIRVKRRIDEDPAEALFLSCKKRKESDFWELKSVLAFAGTINSKDESISKHIKEAIRQKKIRKELHPHTSDFRQAHIPEVTDKLRKEKEQTSRANRYRITCSNRALDLNLLAADTDQGETNPLENSCDSKEKPVSLVRIDTDQNFCDSQKAKKQNIDAGNDESNCVPSSPSCLPDDSVTRRPQELAHDRSTYHVCSSLARDKQSGSPTVCDDSKLLMKEDKMFCIYDVDAENDGDGDQQTKFAQKHQSASGIAVNNVPMLSKKVATAPKVEPEFVYDLYYTHSDLSDLDHEAVLTVQTLCEELVHEQECDDCDRDLVYDDTDDSNDENNWRADYPDEDPHFFENADEDYDYAEDMVDTNFLHEDDDGDLLAYWMNTRCKVDGDSDDGEDEYEREEGDSSESDDS